MKAFQRAFSITPLFSPRVENWRHSKPWSWRSVSLCTEMNTVRVKMPLLCANTFTFFPSCCSEEADILFSLLFLSRPALIVFEPHTGKYCIFLLKLQSFCICAVPLVYQLICPYQYNHQYVINCNAMRRWVRLVLIPALGVQHKY